MTITKLEIMESIELTMDNCNSVIASYEEVNEFSDNPFKTFYDNASVYGLNDETNKFFVWALQLQQMLERLENGGNVKPEKREKLFAKLSKVNRECYQALNGLEVL